MFFSFPLWLRIVLTIVVAAVISYFMTPPVKLFANRIGAIDVPSEARRIHNHPIPRMGGLAIIIGFMVAVSLFVDVSVQVLGILIGAFVIAAMGAVDDIIGLKPWVKLLGQFAAAFIAIRCGVFFNNVSTFSFSPEIMYAEIGWFSIPLTFLWIVGCTNAVNLIDGLDGLAVGVSTISSVTLLVVSLLVNASAAVTIIMAALVGACLGFLPYNTNPASIFMGDVGSQFLGYMLATVSILGMFKMHALITFFVPVMALAVPLADTVFAFFRRILHGQSPFKADRGHFHHRLLAMGLSQKQAVAVLYSVSAVVGLLAVCLTGQQSAVKLVSIALIAVIIIVVWAYFFMRANRLRKASEKKDGEAAAEKEENK